MKELGAKNFWADLERSNDEEIEVVKQLEIICGDSFIRAVRGEKRKEYDLLIETIFGSTTIEVKTDYSHARYGNVAVEFSCRGKSSGISTTEADYWIYRIYEKDGSSALYMISHFALVDMIINQEYKRVVENAGDRGSGTKLFLFKGDVFKERCRLLCNFKSEVT